MSLDKDTSIVHGDPDSSVDHILSTKWQLLPLLTDQEMSSLDFFSQLSLDLWDAMDTRNQILYANYWMFRINPWWVNLSEEDFTYNLNWFIHKKIPAYLINKMEGLAPTEKISLIAKRTGMMTRDRNSSITLEHLNWLEDAFLKLKSGDKVLELGCGEAVTLLKMVDDRSDIEFSAVDLQPITDTSFRKSNLKFFEANLDNWLPKEVLHEKKNIIFSDRALQYTFLGIMRILTQVYDILVDGGEAFLHLWWSSCIDQAVLEHLDANPCITITRKENESALWDGIYLHIVKDKDIWSLDLPEVSVESNPNNDYHLSDLLPRLSIRRDPIPKVA